MAGTDPGAPARPTPTRKTACNISPPTTTPASARSARRADRRQQQRPRAGLRRRFLDQAGLRPHPRPVPDRLRSLLRVQRHGGQFARARVAVPVVSLGDLPRTRARRNRRMRRPRILLRRLEAPHRDGRERQAHAGRDRSGRHAPRRHPLSEAEGRHAHAVDGSRHRLHASRKCARSRRSPSAGI